MPTARYFRARVHDGVTGLATFTSPATAGGSALVVTSLAAGPNPYIAEPPSGDGQSIDLMTGESEIGEYRVKVIDQATSATTRVVTSVLADAEARWQLLSRRAVIEWSTDGATWTTLVLGFLNNLRLAGALTWDLSIGETRRIEMQTPLFNQVAQPSVSGGAITSPSCLLGGPIRAGAGYNSPVDAFAGVKDYGPVRMQVTIASLDAPASVLALRSVGGWYAPWYDGHKTRFQENELVAAVTYGREFFVPDDRSWRYLNASLWSCYGSFPGLVALLTPVAGGTPREGIPLGAMTPRKSDLDDSPAGGFDAIVEKRKIDGSEQAVLCVAWDTATMGAKPGFGTQFDVVVYPRTASASYPIHERGHPVDLVTAKFIAVGVSYDAAAAAAAKAAINAAYGGAVVVELTWDGTQTLGRYAQQMLAFFGVGMRVSGAGALQMFGLRHAVPTPGVTITLAHLRDADSDTFDLDEDSVITTSEQRTREYLFTRAAKAFLNAGSTRDFPLDNLRSAWHTVEGRTDDTVEPGEHRTHRWEIPGRVLVGGAVQKLEAMAAASGNWLINWRRRGVPEFDLHCLSTVTAQVGDLVTVNLPHLPVAIVGAVPTAQRGQAGISARVLRRTETPAGPDLRLVFAPAINQTPLAAPNGHFHPPTPVVPVITLEPSAVDGSRAVIVTLENAEAIVAAGQRVTLEYSWAAIDDPAFAGSGTQVGPYDPANAPASPVRYALPVAPAGSVVWVRAQSTIVGSGVSSAWTDWISLSLSLLPEGVRVSWVLSPLAGSGVRLDLSITDPTAVIARVELRFKARFGDEWPDYTVLDPDVPDVVPAIYHLDGTLVDGYGAYFSYRLSSLVEGGAYEVLEERTIPVGSGADLPAVLAIKLRAFARSREAPAGTQYQVGDTGAQITVDARVRSIRVAASLTAPPTAAETAASGVLIDIPAGVRTVETSPLFTLTYGQQGFVAVLPYEGAAGTGAVGALTWDSARYGEFQSEEEGRTRIGASANTAKLDALANFTAGLQVGGQSVVPGTGTEGYLPIWGAGNVLGNSPVYIVSNTMLPQPGVLVDIGAPGALFSNGRFDGLVTAGFIRVGENSTGNAGIEFGNDMATGTTPFLDFHYGTGFVNDFSGRIISRGQHRLDIEFQDIYNGMLVVSGYPIQRPATYGSIRLSSTGGNGWQGIEFGPSGENRFMVQPAIQGFHRNEGWQWQWTSGVLTIGSVPPARIPAGTFPGASYFFPGSVGITGTLNAGYGNFTDGMAIGGNPVGTVIISTSSPTGTAPAGTLWCKVAT